MWHEQVLASPERCGVFLLAFMLQLYWQYPMVTLWALVHNIKPVRITETVLRRGLTVALGMYKDVKVNEGTLSTGGLGQSPMSNPSERRAGAARFRQLVGELRRWRSCAQSLADLFENTHEVALRAALRVLREANLKTYSGKPNYKNIRLVRALVFCNWRHVRRHRGLLENLASVVITRIWYRAINGHVAL